MGKPSPSAVGQLTLTVCYNQIAAITTSGAICYKVWWVCSVTTVWAMPERFRGELLSTRRYPGAIQLPLTRPTQPFIILGHGIDKWVVSSNQMPAITSQWWRLRVHAVSYLIQRTLLICWNIMMCCLTCTPTTVSSTIVADSSSPNYCVSACRPVRTTSTRGATLAVCSWTPTKLRPYE